MQHLLGNEVIYTRVLTDFLAFMLSNPRTTKITLGVKFKSLDLRRQTNLAS